MAGNRAAQVFSWDMAKDGEWVHVEPLAAALEYGDAVQVGEGQSALFVAGGVRKWIRKPGLYTVGYDDRSEGEILRAHMRGEDMQGLPLLVNTSLTFCCLQERSCRIQLKDYVKINKMLGVRPTFRLRLRVRDDDALIRGMASGASGQDQVADCLADALKEQLNAADVFDEYTVLPEVEEQFFQQTWVDTLLMELARSVSGQNCFGIAVEEVKLADWGLQNGFCDACGIPVEGRAGRCAQGHRLYRCPVCGELIYDGGCKVNGHSVMFCPDCGKYVVPQDGECPLHRHSSR